VVILAARIDTAWYVTWAANHDKRRDQTAGLPDRVGEFGALACGFRLLAWPPLKCGADSRWPRHRLTLPIKNASKGRTVT
jgi:hypothetical protein